MRWAVFVVCLLVGCAPRLTPQDHEAATRLWLRLHPPTAVSFSAHLSVHVNTSTTAGRVLVELTGDPQERLLLTISSSVGSVLALVEETPSQVQVYVPERNVLYISHDPRAVLPAQGLPLPLTLGQLARLLQGDWGAVLPETFLRAHHRDGGMEFLLASGPFQRLRMALDGSQVSAEGHDGLTLEARVPEPQTQRFTLLHFASPEGSAVLRVKDFVSHTPLPAPLTVPASARREPLPSKEMP
ncbi:MAG: hypothetical protein JG760_1157 [Desulfomicrobiaceae bacterium]|nr:hypothetical protein [Desulfomicrobiaceae bacterium]